MRQNFCRLSYLFSLMMLVTSCSNKLNSDDIKKLVSNIPEQRYKRPENRENISKTVEKRITDKGQYYNYREETVSYEKLFDDQSLLNADYSRIYPGSLVTEESVKQSNLAQSRLTTNPMRIGINISHGKTVYVDSVDCNSPSAVTTAMNKILAANPRGYHTNFYSKCAISNSYEETMFKLNLNADWFSGSLKSQFQSTDSRTTQNVYFLLKDEYYQAFCENPNPEKLFENRLNEDDKKYFDLTNQPLVIRSVSYGRVILLRSSISNTTLDKTFSADIEHDFAFAHADAHVFLNNLKKYGITDFEIMAYGGFKDINTGKKETFEYLDSLITKGNTPSIESPGNPISFRVETLNHKPYSVRSVITDYVRTRWNVIPEAEFEIRFNSIKSLTPPNILSDAVIGTFFINGHELRPIMPNNIYFMDYTRPQNLSAGSASFAANNSIFIRVPLNEKGKLDITLAMTQQPDRQGKGDGPDIPASGITSFKILELLDRNKNAIPEKVVASNDITLPIVGRLINQYQADYDIIVDPKKQFNNLYGFQMANYVSQLKPTK
ncbi:hypothetical protein AHMF7605_27190 [Adhaeribacter arboris]|uniref:Thiol-activated cytolysin n=1 Tax=Adhaeribacter arboris TaxID=2072846 RepID=A0A2T2YN59_9BACT|nr:thiol-activated cytolysin family protein [Adhaeribacter arboris]PSR56919.1 hypothetical protein AHMF7605_27190 [Adhaeribacter arboris]